ncbi:G-type lectin S-receptor-like serine/threonine-protein kinase SD2-5 [Vitis vinifera]|uniref:G-type lectin S-receptor-like serine/threonine-protein kinase SD2-5 n=1 Tax=Vitis vinifera TaxID=29760 RepID=A0A438D9U7_VITVI|nr:G-type lectin S-receptor-like serine/threonine-protein kinase SD2-5 [Vitis vinifera]
MIPTLLTATSVFIIAFIAAPPVDIDGIREPVSGSLLYGNNIISGAIIPTSAAIVCTFTQYGKQHPLMNACYMGREWELSFRLGMRPWIAVAYSAPVAAAAAVFLIYPIGQGSFSDGMPLGISAPFKSLSMSWNPERAKSQEPRANSSGDPIVCASESKKRVSCSVLFLLCNHFKNIGPTLNLLLSTQNTGQIYPGFQGSQMEWKDNKGMFLLSNSSTFALGFLNTLEGLFVLVVIHVASSKAVWTANRSFLIQNSDKFVFEKNGNAYLKVAINNLVHRYSRARCYSHGIAGYRKLGFQTPQTYWSMSNESRKTIYKGHGKVHSASMMSNSWNFYDQNQALVWQFNFSENLDPNVTWAGVLDSEGVPEPCEPYYVCSVDNRCQCPSALNSSVNCKPQITSVCNVSKNSVELFISGNCFLFDQIGSFQRSNWYSSGFISYVKVSNNGDLDGGQNHSREERKGYRRKKEIQECSPDNLEEDDFLDSISGMPIRFRYKELQNATSNFSEKLGQGGFGSVYKGVLPDGTQLAVKKLEGVGQGKKEFRAEFYEFLGKGSLDKLIFKNNRKDLLLDWETRFSIALGTAKGLAYLHEECDPRIIHCDIKPENVLLDDNYLAKVSDFGLAKLMNRDQSHVFTTVRGTRGYLAPEWIANHAISEKSDVFSFGMVLLEIIGGRKNYDPKETAQKAHFPSYAFERMKEGKFERDPRSRAKN